MSKIRFADVEFACQACSGNITRASERLGVTRWALQKYLQRTPQARALFDEWRQKLIDEAETALWDCVKERQPWAVALVLKTLGRHRGYVERVETEDLGDHPVIRLTWGGGPEEPTLDPGTRDLIEGVPVAGEMGAEAGEDLEATVRALAEEVRRRLRGEA